MRAGYILGLTVVSLILMLQIPIFSAAEIPPNEIIMVAQGGMKSFIQTISKEDVGEFGFASYEEANNATLGEGFQIFTVSPDSPSEQPSGVSGFKLHGSSYDSLEISDKNLR